MKMNVGIPWRSINTGPRQGERHGVPWDGGDVHPDDVMGAACDAPDHVPIDCKQWLVLCPEAAKKKLSSSPTPRTGSARPHHNSSQSGAASAAVSDTASSSGTSSTRRREESGHPDASRRLHSRGPTPKDGRTSAPADTVNGPPTINNMARADRGIDIDNESGIRDNLNDWYASTTEALGSKNADLGKQLKDEKQASSDNAGLIQELRNRLDETEVMSSKHRTASVRMCTERNQQADEDAEFVEKLNASEKSAEGDTRAVGAPIANKSKENLDLKNQLRGSKLSIVIISKDMKTLQESYSRASTNLFDEEQKYDLLANDFERAQSTIKAANQKLANAKLRATSLKDELSTQDAGHQSLRIKSNSGLAEAAKNRDYLHSKIQVAEASQLEIQEKLDQAMVASTDAAI